MLTSACMASDSSKSKTLSQSLQLAESFKENCRQLIKERTKTREAKEKLAKELKITVGGVEGLIYHGRGSFENFIAALAFVYEADEETLSNCLGAFRSPQRVSKLKPSDKIWFELDSQMEEPQKEFFAELIRTSTRLGYELKVTKSKNSVK